VESPPPKQKKGKKKGKEKENSRVFLRHSNDSASQKKKEAMYSIARRFQGGVGKIKSKKRPAIV
jgi:hypothetical protein